MSHFDIPTRLTRLRRSPMSRSLVQENRLHPHQLIAPIIINANIDSKKEISSMPGQFQFSLNDLHEEVAELSALNIPALLLFGVPESKDATGSDSYSENGVIQKAIRRIREVNQEILIITDLCFCEYTDHGHCGVLNGEHIDNDKTLSLLQKQAISHVKAGADWLAPSGMTDGMIAAIRSALDSENFKHIPIMSYSVKYCSCLYEPFRKAAEGAPKFGDRKSYQMNPANGNEAIREAELDVSEGADVLMVKPATLYLDVIYRIKETFKDIPLCTYHVGGEYSMIKAAAKEGYIDEDKTIIESLMSIKRAGADMIITYFAKQAAELITKPQ